MRTRLKNSLMPGWQKPVEFRVEQIDSPRVAGKAEIEERPTAATPTVLVVSTGSAASGSLSDTVRRYSNWRVLHAAGAAEAQYLVAVEGNIRLLLADSLSNENLTLARWFLATQSGATAMIAGDSLWKVTGGAGRWERMLMAKYYTPEELVATLRVLIKERPNGTSESLCGLKAVAWFGAYGTPA